MKRSILFALMILMLALTACSGGAQSSVQRTPIPTLLPALQPVGLPQAEAQNLGQGDCRIYALDLLGAWVKADYKEDEAFGFFDTTGKECTGTYADDIQPLFHQPNVWYSGAIACTTCHGEDLTRAAAQMDLTTYAAIVAGSRRADAAAQGNSILDDGTGSWEKSRLYVMIATKQMPPGRPPTDDPRGPIVLAGKAR